MSSAGSPSGASSDFTAPAAPSVSSNDDSTAAAYGSSRDFTVPAYLQAPHGLAPEDVQSRGLHVHELPRPNNAPSDAPSDEMSARSYVTAPGYDGFGYLPPNEEEEEDDDDNDSSDSDSEARRHIKEKKNKEAPEAPASAAAGLADPSAVDWNSSYQDALERRDYAALVRISNDFLHVASEYGRLIISELCLPEARRTLRTRAGLGIAGGDKIIVQGILFKLARDVTRPGWGGSWLYGGSTRSDENAAKSAGHDLRGAARYFSAAAAAAAPGAGGEPVDVALPLQVLIDYRGYRCVAMPILPIGRQQRAPALGSADGGRTIGAGDEDWARIMARLAAQLHIKAHRVRGVLVHSAVDVEGHCGDDGRRYLLDMGRSFPPESPTVMAHLPRAPNSVFYRMMRPELLQYLRRHTDVPPLSCDAYTLFGVEGKEEHNCDVDRAASVLLTQIIPAFAQWLAEELGSNAGRRRWETLPDVSQRLTTEFHRRGVNMRHLGLVRSLLSLHTCAVGRSLLLMEMVKRTLKNDLRAWLRREIQHEQTKRPSASQITQNVVHFLNLTTGAADSAAVTAFWRDVVARMHDRFGQVAFDATDEALGGGGDDAVFHQGRHAAPDGAVEFAGAASALGSRGPAAESPSRLSKRERKAQRRSRSRKAGKKKGKRGKSATKRRGGDKNKKSGRSGRQRNRTAAETPPALAASDDEEEEDEEDDDEEEEDERRAEDGTAQAAEDGGEEEDVLERILREASHSRSPSQASQRAVSVSAVSAAASEAQDAEEQKGDSGGARPGAVLQEAVKAQLFHIVEYVLRMVGKALTPKCRRDFRAAPSEFQFTIADVTEGAPRTKSMPFVLFVQGKMMLERALGLLRKRGQIKVASRLLSLAVDLMESALLQEPTNATTKADVQLASGALACVQGALARRGSTALIEAAIRKDVNVARALLEKNVDVNYQAPGDGLTALLAAVLGGGPRDMVSLLLVHGADPSLGFSNTGMTPLHLAVQKNSTTLIRILLEEGGADPMQRNATKQTALHLAAERGAAETIELVLRFPNDFNAKDRAGRRALDLAKSRQFTEGVRLIQAAQGPQRDLMAAARNGNVQLVKSLLQSDVDVDCVDERGRTPLQHALDRGHAPVVELLLAHGANVEQKCGAHANSPLVTAVERAAADPAFKSASSIAQALCKAGAHTEARNGMRETPLVTASRHGDLMLVKTLLHFGADVAAVDENRYTALLWAAFHGHVACVRALIGAGSDVNAANAHGWSPLLRATWKNHEAVVEELLAAGVDVGFTNAKGRTALHYCAQRGHAQIARLLLARGADPAARDKKDKTPADYAREREHTAVLDVLCGARG